MRFRHSTVLPENVNMGQSVSWQPSGKFLRINAAKVSNAEYDNLYGGPHERWCSLHRSQYNGSVANGWRLRSTPGSSKATNYILIHRRLNSHLQYLNLNADARGAKSDSSCRHELNPPPPPFAAFILYLERAMALESDRGGLVFTAHSLPWNMSQYQHLMAQNEETDGPPTSADNVRLPSRWLA